MVPICQFTHEHNEVTMQKFSINDKVYFDLEEVQCFGVVAGFTTTNEHKLIMLKVYNIYTNEVVVLNPNRLRKFDD